MASTLDLITRPFAENGDKMNPPDTSPTGFVNYSDGYTADYEISLASGNPQAKAVERQIQNYMFNQSSQHQMAWEQMGFAPWFATMPGGYAKGAFVIRQAPSGEWRPYRSLTDGNTSDPNVQPLPIEWEYQRTMAEIIGAIPMPSGGGNPSSEIITIGRDFNTLTTGTWEVKDNATAAACTNCPSQKAGMLESKAWAGASANVAIQRYSDIDGNLFLRANNGSVWLSWFAVATEALVRRLIGNVRGTLQYTQGQTLDPLLSGNVFAPTVGTETILNLPSASDPAFGTTYTGQAFMVMPGSNILMVTPQSGDTIVGVGSGTPGTAVGIPPKAFAMFIRTAANVWLASVATLTSGAVGGGNDRVFWENDQAMTTNYTITTGKNALVAGPLTIPAGVTLTIPSGSVVSIV